MSNTTPDTAPTTHPRVVAIFVYRNPRAAKTPEAEYDRLISFFTEANAQHIVTFVKIVQFDEQQSGTVTSYNFSLVPRDIDMSREPTIEDLMRMFRQRDLLVGTRGGTEGAMVWLSNLAAAFADDPQPLQTFNQIFGESLPHFSAQPHLYSIQEMINLALGVTQPAEHRTEPSRH
jgi:hypothetical protein